MDFVTSADHSVSIKESEKIKKFFDLAKEQKKLRTIKVTVIPIVFEALGTFPNSLKKRADE